MIASIVRIIRHANFSDTLPNLHPHITCGRDREELTQCPITRTRDNKPAEEVQIINIRRTLRHRFPNSANETDNVDKNTADIRGVSTPVEAESVEIWGIGFRGVELFDLKVSLADKVVIRDNDARNRGEEDGICRKICGEVVSRGEEIPRTHDEADERADITAAADVQIAGEESSHVGSCGDGVRSDVGAELGEAEGGGNEEDAYAVGGAAFGEEGLEELERVPDWFAFEDYSRRGGNDDANEGGYGKAVVVSLWLCE